MSNKIISIKFQEVIMFVPFLNCFVLFIWLYNYSRMEKNTKIFSKSLCILFLSTIPIVILQIIFQKIFVDYNVLISVLDYLMLYIIPFSMAFNLVHFQKNILKSKKDNHKSTQETEHTGDGSLC